MVVEGALTDDEIIDTVLNADKEKENVINDNEFVQLCLFWNKLVWKKQKNQWIIW